MKLFIFLVVLITPSTIYSIIKLIYYCLTKIQINHFHIIIQMLSQKEISSFIKQAQNKQSHSSSKHFLNLSKKQLRKIPEIDYLKNGSDSVDVSYNYLKSLLSLRLKNFQQQSNANNSSSEIIHSESVVKPKCLQWLDISFNFLTTIHQYEPKQMNQFSNLKFLNACTNKIQYVSLDDHMFPSLQQLHLKNNQIHYFTFAPKNLQILSLDNNLIKTLAFKGGQNLQILSASKNKIQILGFIAPNLLFLELQSNCISDLQIVVNQLVKTKTILSVNLLQNQVSQKKQLKVQILSICDKIVKINQTYISPHIRQGFRILKEQQKLDYVLQKTAQQYQQKLQQQLKYKEEMLQKLKADQQNVQHNFRKYVQTQKQQMNLLQMYAKNTLAQSRFKITTESQQFSKKLEQQNLSSYKQMSQLKRNNLKSGQQNQKEQNHQKDIKKIQRQYKRQYQTYLNQLKSKENAKHLNQNLMQSHAISEQSQSYHQNNSIFHNMQSNLKKNDAQSRINNHQKQKGNNKLHYKTSRYSIQLNGVQKLNQKANQIQVQPESQKQIPLAYTQSKVRNKKKNLQSNSKEDQVLDLRCMAYLQKHYSFY